MSVLLVSGGHTQIIEAHNAQSFHIIAQSLDDSFGESFDKVAKMLSLGYPGGPIIESYASKLAPTTALHPLPLPLKDRQGFSFSGLKNATRLLIESLHTQNDCSKLDSSLSESDRAVVCASFQQAAIAHIANQVEKYLKHKQHPKIRDFAIVGGASSNAALRAEIARLCAHFGLSLHLAPLEFCADNAAMIGRAAIPEWETRHFADVIAQEVSPRSTTNYLRICTHAP